MNSHDPSWGIQQQVYMLHPYPQDAMKLWCFLDRVSQSAPLMCALNATGQAVMNVPNQHHMNCFRLMQLVQRHEAVFCSQIMGNLLKALKPTEPEARTAWTLIG